MSRSESKPTKPVETATRLRLAVTHLSRRMRQESGTEPILTPSRYSFLWAIEANGPMRMTDLARMELVSKSSITRSVGTLSDLGFVELLPDPTDGRSTLIRATPEGKRVLASTSQRTDAYLAQQLATFSDAEQVLLDAALLLLERLSPSEGGEAPSSTASE